MMKIREHLNCPNCGMPIVGEKCEYCGTVFIDFACLELDKPFYIKFRYDNKILRAKCRTSDIVLNSVCSVNDEIAYSDNKVYHYSFPRKVSMDIHIDFIDDIVDDKSCLYETIDLDKVSQEELKKII